MALDTNLIAYYKFENNGNDALGSYNATANNITYAAGWIGQGAVFNGSNGYLTIPNLPYGAAGGIVLGFNGTTPSDYFHDSSDGNRFYCYNNGNTGIDIAFNNSAINNINLGWSSGNPGSGWHQIIITWGGGSYYVYYDGSLVSTGSMTVSAVTPAVTYIGSRYSVSDLHTGMMDERGYWSRLLTSGDVTELWNGGAGLTYPFGNIKSVSNTAYANVKSVSGVVKASINKISGLEQ